MTGPFDSWTCLVCGDERPDALISVAHHPIPGMEERFPEARHNIRYCNDRPACVEYAQRPGPWTGPGYRYRVDVPCPGLPLDFDHLTKVGPVIYPVEWSSVRGVTHAYVYLWAGDADAASRHAVDDLRRAGLTVSGASDVRQAGR